MADKSKTKLPNLKICIDNADSDDSVSSESSEDDKLSLDDDEEIDELQESVTEEKEEDEETSLHVSSDTKTDIEFNVLLGPKSKKRTEILPFLKTYENKAGSFVTGIDLTNEEELKKKEERAKRFGIEISQENEANILDLYKSLGIREEDLSRKDERGIRLEAIHFRGVDDMNTKDIFAYFKEFGPAGVEWIDDSSCNVVWLDKVTAARAMMKLSRSYDVLMQQLEGKEMEQKGAEGSDSMETNENKEKNDKRKENKSETHKLGDQDKKKWDAGSLRDGEEPMEEGSDDDDSLDLTEDTRKTVVKDKSSKAEKESKVADKEAKSDREEGEITDDSDSEDEEDQRSDQGQKENRGEGKSQRRKKKIPWPPGKWRLGITTSKARYLFMRFATKADTKLPGAEKRSRYYQKYGNPNYGGIKGLISTSSRKRKYNATRIHDDVEESVEKAQRKIVSYAGVDMFTDVINKDDDVRNVEHADSAWGVGPNKPVSDQPKFIFEKSPEEEKPRFILEQSEQGPKQTKDVSEDSDESEVDEEELERLLGPPIKKRTMRMYADDVEEEIKKKKTLQQGDLTITTDTKRGSSPVRIKDARELIKGLQVKPKETDIKSRLQLKTRVSPLVWDDENSRSSNESERDDGDDDHTSSPDTRHVKSRVSLDRSPDSRLYRTIKNKETDLRSKLDTRKKTGSSKFQNMKIEVFD
ncbi:hypothetical protein CHS0354_034377 [Potamilus streckersoni]|uniref:Nuclear cap-binding protein subunit 3 n=1 Tax=Potamilus streckersoni TaxID=2493646 RepID=A0AAE0TJN0_9BIVA|nr:hypothetical protein CHS0354_034377 [Potamilus streckersoni]